MCSRVLRWLIQNRAHSAGASYCRSASASPDESCRGGERFAEELARFGGEEFVSLLVGTELADALLTALRDGDFADTVFDRADAALYRAKNSGRNVCIAV